MNNASTTTSTTTSTTVTTSSTAPSLLRRLLSTPSASSQPPPTFNDLLSRPGPSSAPPPTFDSLQRELLTLPAPPPPTNEEDASIPVIHLPDNDDFEWELVRISTAHPNYHDPELRDLVIADLLCDTLPLSTPLPSLPPAPLQDTLPSLEPVQETLPPTLPSSPTYEEISQCPALLSPLLFSPPTSPPSSPLAQLPERRLKFNRLQINTSYEVKTWHKIGAKFHCIIFNHEKTTLYIIDLPNTIRRPTRQQRHHHLFEGNLYLHVSKINGKFNFTFHS